jgi:hypothetical protein
MVQVENPANDGCSGASKGMATAAMGQLFTTYAVLFVYQM